MLLTLVIIISSAAAAAAAAQVAFLDEIFKANSAVLNSLLTILNERVFDNGSKRLPVPLLAVVGASNELPDRYSWYIRYRVTVLLWYCCIMIPFRGV